MTTPKPRILDVNQRPDREVVLRCSCGSPHFLVFTASEWAFDGESAERWMDAYVIDEYRPLQTLRGRLVGIWRMLRGETVERGHSVDFNESDVMAIRAWCDSLLPAEQPS